MKLTYKESIGDIRQEYSLEFDVEDQDDALVLLLSFIDSDRVKIENAVTAPEGLNERL